MSAAAPASTPPRPRLPWAAVAGLVANAFAWGVSWWPLRQLQAMGLHPLWATSIFFLTASVLITLWRPAAWRDLARYRLLWLLALASGLTNAAFNWAVSIGDVVRVVLLFYLMPVWAMLLARAWLGEQVSRVGWLRMALGLCGAALVLMPGAQASQAAVTRSVLADGLGLLGGMCFALNNVLLRKEARRSARSRALAMFVGGTVAPLLIAVLLQHAHRVPPPPVLAWPWVALALAQALFLFGANLALQFGAGRVAVNVTSVIMLSEVLFAALSSWLLAGEALTWPKLAGGGLIIVGALLSAVVD
jgi:drug/metabolite transporter (DMT)-like permease